MSGARVRDFRKQASKVARQTVDTVAPAINAALENEQVTRGRVDDLESWAQAFSSRTLKERLRWLLLGR